MSPKMIRLHIRNLKKYWFVETCNYNVIKSPRYWACQAKDSLPLKTDKDIRRTLNRMQDRT